MSACSESSSESSSRDESPEIKELESRLKISEEAERLLMRFVQFNYRDSKILGCRIPWPYAARVCRSSPKIPKIHQTKDIPIVKHLLYLNSDSGRATCL